MKCDAFAYQLLLKVDALTLEENNKTNYIMAMNKEDIQCYIVQQQLK